MNIETIEQNKTVCDKCGGDGKNFSHNSHEFFKNWRKSIAARQWLVAEKLQMDKARLSKFENGRETFSESLLRRLAKVLTELEPKNIKI